MVSVVSGTAGDMGTVLVADLGTGQRPGTVGRRGSTRGWCVFFVGGGVRGGRHWKYGNWKDDCGVDVWARLFSDRFFRMGGGNASVNSSGHLHCDAAGPLVVLVLVFNLGR